MVSSLLCSGHVFCCRQWGKLNSNNNRAAAAAGGWAMKTTLRWERINRILFTEKNLEHGSWTSILTYFIEFTYKIFPNIQHSQVIWTTEARAVHVWLVDNNIVVTMNILERVSLMEHWNSFDDRTGVLLTWICCIFTQSGRNGHSMCILKRLYVYLKFVFTI